MKNVLIAAMAAVCALTAVATSADARPMGHGHRHQVCTMRHHHRMCSWR